MMHRLLLGCATLAAFAGCYLGGPLNADQSGSGDGANGGAGSSVNGGAASDTGLPCDVQTMLQTNCTSCHASTPVGGAPMPLVTYADLTANAKSDPTKTVAVLSALRMQSTTSPMPPGTHASATDIATLQNWISAGYPHGTCGSDGGASAVAVCTSGVYSRASEGTSMRPGEACISCHKSRSGETGPIYAIAGTVYPTMHEPDSCDGANGSTDGAQVIITDANGNQLPPLNVNSVGTFVYQGSIALPFTAKVVQGGKTRAMATPQTSGDCNSCHTVDGANGAPGRIMLP